MSAVAVAAPHWLAVDAASDAVAAGGNALDAALAAATVLTVVYPHQCALGGDLTALVRRPDGTVEAILSLGAAAAATDVEGLRARCAGSGMPSQGIAAVTVPGIVAGWMALAGLGASLGLAAPLRRAAALARDGAPVSPGLERALTGGAERVAADPGLRAVLGDVGETFTQPALARTFDELADDPDSFYRGPLAARFAAGLAALGSALTEADLAAHAAERPAPLTLDAGAVRWWAAPPPSQGATALALLDPERKGDLLTRARAAHAARARLLGDPRGGPVDLDGLLRPAAPDRVLAAAPPATGDTVAIAAVDDEGRSVTLIQSLFMSFGAGLLEPDTGIVLQNRGASFALLDDPAAHAAHPARLAPGLRPPHTLCPLLAEGDDVRVALGCQGGRGQPLILAQVAPAAVDPGASLADAVAADRWVLDEAILAEPGAPVPPAGDLPIVRTPGPDDRCGHVQVARATAAGLEAASDPRADGRAG